MTSPAPAATAQGAPGRRDPRLGPPTARDRRRSWLWLAFLGISPICIGVVVWASLDLNGSYPTVKPPVPAGWQAVPGIYASFSAPKSWSLDQAMSDSAGDIYYRGTTGAVGESVTESDQLFSLSSGLPTIVATYVGGHYTSYSRQPYHLKHATNAWLYTFRLPGGGQALGVRAWVKATLSQVWLITPAATQTERRILSTLTLAS
jgi:hypothetical protein